MTDNRLNDISEFNIFPNLKSLIIDKNRFSEIEKIPAMPSL